MARVLRQLIPTAAILLGIASSTALTSCSRVPSPENKTDPNFGSVAQQLEDGWLKQLRALDAKSRDADLSFALERDRYQELVASYVAYGNPASEALAQKPQMDAALGAAREAQNEVNAAMQYGIEAAETPEQILEVALGVYAVRVRYGLGPISHGWMRWSGGMKVDDRRPACTDLTYNQILFDLAEAILKDAQPLYVRSMANVLRSLDCARFADAKAVDSVLASAFSATIADFPAGKQDAARRALVSSLANVLLLVADETRYAGKTPIFELFSEHLQEFKESASVVSTPIRIHGLWLKNSASGSLYQIRQLCESGVDSDCVSLTHLLQTIVDPFRLGLGGCTAEEMVSPHLDEKIGYLCQKQICGTSYGADLLLAGSGNTVFGVPIEEVQASACPGGMTGSGSSWGDYGGGLPGIGGMQPRAVVQCITSSYHEIWREQLSCAADVLASLKSPTTVASAPDFSTCASPKADGQTPPKASPENQKKATDAANKLADEWESATADEVQKYDDAGLTSVDAFDVWAGAAELRDTTVLSDAEWDAKFKGTNCESQAGCTQFSPNADGSFSYDIYLKESNVAAYNDEELGRLLSHEGSHVAQHSDDSTRTEDDHHKITDKLGYNEVWCDASDGSCMMGCSPAAVAAAAFGECISGTPTNEFRGAPNDDLIKIPLDDSTNSSWSGCLSGNNLGVGASLSTRCTAMRCAGVSVPQLVNGSCSCAELQESGGATARNNCAVTLCGEGTTAVAGGSGQCLCQPSTTFASSLPPAPLPELGGMVDWKLF